MIIGMIIRREIVKFGHGSIMYPKKGDVLRKRWILVIFLKW